MSAPTAKAQTAPKWEIEFHGGGTFAGNATGGQAKLPDAGAPFTTVAGRASRRISSWYFGDGAKLLNEVNAAFAALGAPAPAIGRIVPLDPVLNAALAERRNGGSFGVRFARVINRRLKAEVSVDNHRGALEISKDVAVRIEASRASFLTAWASLLSTGPFAAPSVASVSAIDEGSAHQVLTVGTLNINLASPGRFTPHATVGAGLLSNIGDAPSVTLSGRYQFAFGNIFPVNEKDTVTVRYTEAAKSIVWVVGAGFTYDVFQRSGVRVDVRAHLSSNRGRTTVSAHPEVVTQTSSFPIASGTSPGIQFINNPSLSARSSLSGPDIVDFETFTGSGVQRHVAVTAGWYWRF